MHVVSACVHDTDIRPAIVLGPDDAGVRQAGALGHGQGVELGSQHHRRTRTVFQYANYSRTANPGGHVIPELTKSGRQLGRGLLLVVRELWMLMEIPIQCVGLRVDAFDFYRNAGAALRAALSGNQQRQCTRQEATFHR